MRQKRKYILIYFVGVKFDLLSSEKNMWQGQLRAEFWEKNFTTYILLICM
jgi:hypothetical protein